MITLLTLWPKAKHQQKLSFSSVLSTGVKFSLAVQKWNPYFLKVKLQQRKLCTPSVCTQVTERKSNGHLECCVPPYNKANRRWNFNWQRWSYINHRNLDIYYKMCIYLWLSLLDHFGKSYVIPYLSWGTIFTLPFTLFALSSFYFDWLLKCQG